MTFDRSSTLARILRAGGACAALSFAPAAEAQTDVARAESLFLQGKAFLDQKKFDQACPMFAESARLDPSSGVELALGICYEGQGKTASAWGAYSAAETLARRDARRDREAAATERAKALEPQLSRVTFVPVPETASIAGLAVYEDGTLLASVSWAGGPVDPGTHTVEVRAPGHVTFTSTFVVKDGGDRVTVSIPALAVAPAPTMVVAPPPVVTPPPPPAPTPWRAVGFTLVGTGGASVIVASILGGLAIGKASTVHHDCPSSPCSDQAAVSENQTAGTFADASTGLFVAGGALAAGGLAILLFAPRHSEEAPTRAAGLTVQPTVAPGYLGLSGRF